MNTEIDREPCHGAVYFLLWNESINTTKVANEIISVNDWYTSTSITSFRRNADRPASLFCYRIIIAYKHFEKNRCLVLFGNGEEKKNFFEIFKLKY